MNTNTEIRDVVIELDAAGLNEQMIKLARAANVEALCPIGALPFAARSEQPVTVGSVRHMEDGSYVLVVSVGAYESERHDGGVDHNDSRAPYKIESYQEYDGVPCSQPNVRVRQLMEHPDDTKVIWVGVDWPLAQ